ncbi:class I adenylate-forming enzyme family protein [Neobacillus sp. NPDC097160]|uniref:class I adenylate-forming enzyme family protein n=1 Tax=Neobacillus sp. NPDC097160 TaxID=3364298 RepID=UPI0038260A6E
MGFTNHLNISYLIKREGLDLNKKAIVFEGESLTYKELRDRSLGFANGLYEMGVRKGDRVVVVTKNCLEFWEINFGIYETGGIVVPLNSRLSPVEIGHLIKHAEPKVIVFDRDHVEHIQCSLREYNGASLVYLGEEEISEFPNCKTYSTVLAGAATDPLDILVDADDPAEIIYTSGTTGFPKGAVWTHGTVLWNSIQQSMDYRITSDDSVYVLLGLNYIGGRHEFTMSVFHQGGTVHIRRMGDYEINETVDYIEKHKISLILLVPIMLHDMHRTSHSLDKKLKSLKMIMCGGAPVPVPLIEKTMEVCPHVDVIQVYGSTEIGGTVSALKKSDSIRKIGSCGKPTLHNLISIVDEQGQPVQIGQPGEIIVKGPAIVKEYWRNPEKTQNAFKDGWFYTGDIGKMDEENFLYIVGRKKDMIISGGMNIYPEEIELTLRKHPGINDCAIIGVPDERWGESIMAIIHPNESALPTEQEVIDYCRKYLGSYKKPKYVKFVPELPRTQSGKIQKFILRDQFSNVYAK